MGFWITIIAIATGVGAVLGLTLIRGRVGDAPPAAYDLKVYRDQLKEVERDLARGVIGAEDAERVRTEVSRRVLAADAELRAHQDGRGTRTPGGLALAGLLAVVVSGGAVALYAGLGAPGYGDMPLKARIAASEAARATRLSQAKAEAKTPPRTQAPAAPEFLELMEKLRQTVQERPDDLQGLELLVRNEAALGNVIPAYQAQAKVIQVKGAAATANDYALKADLMIAAAGGYVSNEAEADLQAALQRQPDLYTARYYMGLYLLQIDRPDGAFRMWEELLRDSPPDAPWVGPIRAQLEDVAWRAGIQYKLPPQKTAQRGPSDDDIAVAAGQSDTDRAAMIEAMVDGLSARLATQGGTPQEWAQLMRAHVVLEQGDSALIAYTKAREAFSENAEALEYLRLQAQELGMPE